MALSKKQKAALFSVISSTVLIVLKTVAGVLSGSLSIISEAIHSGMDLIAAVIAYVSVTFSNKPPDETHPYGHGKIENISGVIEALLILLAAGLIIKEAVEKLLNPQPVEATMLGIGVMLVSVVANAVVSRILYKTAREEDSIALEADALHLKTDVYTSAGVAAGLIFLKVTNIHAADPLMAIGVALLIGKEAWQLCCVAFRPLLDVRLDEDEEQPIKEILQSYGTKNGMRIANLRTRKSGAQRFIDFHLYLSPEMSLEDSCSISAKMKKELLTACPKAHIHINIETLDRYTS